MIRSKRSSVVDVGFAAVLLFMVGLVVFIGNFTINEFSTRWANNTLVNSSPAAVESVQVVAELTDSRFDYISFIMLIGLTLAIIITGWMVAGNPIFSFIYFIALIVFVVVSSILSFVWQRFTEKAIFTATLLNFPITNFIMLHLPTYIAIIGFIGMVVIFAKPRDV